jgi:secreted trypsin-like serine protease
VPLRLLALLAALAGSAMWASQQASSSPTSAATRAKASVVGGAPASIEQFPFLVALYDPRAGSPAAGFFCGGVIIDATHVVTAAHCIVEAPGSRSVPADRISVLAGSSTLAPPQPGSVVDPVRSGSVDSRYDPATSDYDVALLTLERPLWTGPAPPANGVDRIAPLAPDARLAARYGDPNRTPAPTATASGWGDLNPAPSEPASYPSDLHAVRLPLVSDPDCETQYAAIEQPITGRMICAGGGRLRLDTCYGDSGGPLLVDREDPPRPPGDYVLVGLVDFGNGCAQSGYAGVYTRIASPAITQFLASGVGRLAGSAASRGRRRKKRHARR